MDRDQSHHSGIFQAFEQYHYSSEYIERVLNHRAFQQLVRLDPIDSDYLDCRLHHLVQDQVSCRVLVDNVVLIRSDPSKTKTKYNTVQSKQFDLLD